MNTEYLISPGESCFTPSEAKKLTNRINALGYKVNDVRGLWIHYTHLNRFSVQETDKVSAPHVTSHLWLSCLLESLFGEIRVVKCQYSVLTMAKDKSPRNLGRSRKYRSIPDVSRKTREPLSNLLRHTKKYLTMEFESNEYLPSMWTQSSGSSDRERSCNLGQLCRTFRKS